MPHTPVQVLNILIARMESRAQILERCSLTGGYDIAIGEIRKFANMLKKARDYLDNAS